MPVATATATISTHFRILSSSIPFRLLSISFTKPTLPPPFPSISPSTSTTSLRYSYFTSPPPSAAAAISMAPPSKTNIVAEYAKSGRSSCKKCSQPIPAKSLRLGLVSRDSRGFDMTKWHHLHCFSQPFDSLDLISGFDSLQSCDQEDLKKLVGECKISNGDNEVEKGSTKARKSPEADNDGAENNVSKKVKLTDEAENKIEIVFSTSDVKETYKGATLLPKWKSFQTVIFLETDDGLRDSDKIAAFDFDGCLAKTSVKRIGADAWSLMYPSIPDKLRSLYSDGYKLVIFTNESNIDRWKNKRQVAVDSKIGRLNNFIQHVQLPIQVFIACGYSTGLVEDSYRKPNPGMWRLMENHLNSGIPIDMEQLLPLPNLFELCKWMFQLLFVELTLYLSIFACRSFYVGDAAGRNDDHSDADIKFAQAVGLKFHVPEDFFDA
ncbi:Polynucleotide 3'-phosphatase ZDP [Linum perenne]